MVIAVRDFASGTGLLHTRLAVSLWMAASEIVLFTQAFVHRRALPLRSTERRLIDERRITEPPQLQS